MTRVHGENPVADMSDDRLKRKFQHLYRNVHYLEGGDGFLRRQALYALESELIDRGFDPAEVVPGKVLSRE